MNGRKIFWRLFFSYASLLLISLSVILTLSQASTRFLKTAIDKQAESTLGGAAESINTLLTSLDSYAMALLHDQDLVSFMNLTDIAPNDAKLSQVYKSIHVLRKYQLMDSLVQDIYLISGNNDMVVFSSHAIRNTPLFYESLFGFTGLDYEAFQAFCTDKTLTRGYHVFDDAGEAVVYLSRFPGDIQQKGLLMIRMNPQALKTLLAPACMSEGSFAVMLDQENRIMALQAGDGTELSALAFAQHVQAETPSAEYEQYSVHTIAAKNGWRFFSVTPLDVALADVHESQRMVAAIIVLLVGIGVLISYLLTRQKAKSLGNMVEALAGQGAILPAGSRNEYRMIEDAVSSLVDDHTSIRKTSANQQALLCVDITRRLMLKEYMQIDDLFRRMVSSGVVWNPRRYGVITLLLEPQAFTAEEYHQPIQQALDAAWGGECFLCRISSARISILFLLDAAYTLADWQRKSQAICEALNLLTDGEVIFCISNLHDELTDVQQAYEETILLCEYGNTRRQQQTYYHMSNLSQADALYYYPVEKETAIVACLQTGDIESLQRIIDEIYNENFVRRTLSTTMRKQLMHEIRATITRSLSSMANDQMNDRIDELNDKVTVSEMLDYVMRISQQLSHTLTSPEQIESARISREIVEMINTRYQDSSFDIKTPCRELGMSESALYVFIREHFSHSFAEMLEKKRMEKACECMRSSVEIKELAALVGYNSDHSFRRAFKRVMGILPSAYVNLCLVEGSLQGPEPLGEKENEAGSA